MRLIDAYKLLDEIDEQTVKFRQHFEEDNDSLLGVGWECAVAQTIKLVADAPIEAMPMQGVDKLKEEVSKHFMLSRGEVLALIDKYVNNGDKAV